MLFFEACTNVTNSFHIFKQVTGLFIKYLISFLFDIILSLKNCIGQ